MFLNTCGDKVSANKVPIYLIGISFFFFCSGTIFSQLIVKRPSLSSAPFTFTSSAIVKDLGMIMTVPFVDTLTTNLDHSLPLTVAEFNEFGNAKENKEHFDYIRSYSPYENINEWKEYIPATSGVLIGGFTLLNDWMVRSEVRNALSKLYVRNLSTNKEEELTITDEKVITPGSSLMQKNRNTNKLYVAYHSPKTPGKSYIYDIVTKEKKLVKEEEVPSGHNPNDYLVERLSCDSHDGKKIPLTITRHKKTKLDGSANLLLYAYGSYGASMGPGFSSSRLSLINRNIIWVTAHIRGGMERGMHWWKGGKMLNKKNTFKDYVATAKFLIEKKYTDKGKIIGMGGSAGGLLMGVVANEAPELFLGMIMAVPFVDTLTTNLNHSLPLTVAEFNEFGNAKENKEHFDYRLSLWL